MDTLSAFVSNLSGNVEGLGVVLSGPVVLSLFSEDVSEISEVNALSAFVSNLSGNVDGLGVVLKGPVILSLLLVNGSEIADRFSFPSAIVVLLEDLERT